MKSHILLLLIFLVKAISAKTIVTSLPGYSGNLQFSLETGYVGVEDEVKQLFYYFVESQNDPETDPILVWNSGGPAFSSLWGFFYVNGPLKFDLSYKFDGTLPRIIDNENSWTSFMNILFVDGPAGTGFSYSTGSYNTSNYAYGSNLNEFIHKWLADHQKYQSHSIYLAGDGYAGNFLPITMLDIQKDNANGVLPYVNFEGYIMVGPGMNTHQDFNYRYIYANRMGMIPDDIFEPAVQTCYGNYTDPPNEECKAQMVIIKGLIQFINTAMWTEPSCGGDFQLINATRRRSLQQKPFDNILKQSVDVLATCTEAPACRSYTHEICNAWANYTGVFDALGVEPGTKDRFALYNSTVDQTYFNKTDIQDLVPLHRQLINTKLNALIMSGDHDMDIPYLSTVKSIDSLELDLVEQWRSWSVDVNETHGYTKKLTNEVFNLTFATVKGAGHFAPEFKRRECYNFVSNWTRGIPV